MATIETKERFIELRAKGWSFDRIAKDIGKAKQTLIDWSKELQGEIANSKAIETEIILEKYHLLKQHRVKTFASILTKLQKEVESRDLSEVETHKLLELYLKYNIQMKAELTEPTYKSSEEIEEEKQEKQIVDSLNKPTINITVLNSGLKLAGSEEEVEN